MNSGILFSLSLTILSLYVLYCANIHFSLLISIVCQTRTKKFQDHCVCVCAQESQKWKIIIIIRCYYWFLFGPKKIQYFQKYDDDGHMIIIFLFWSRGGGWFHMNFKCSFVVVVVWFQAKKQQNQWIHRVYDSSMWFDVDEWILEK